METGNERSRLVGLKNRKKLVRMCEKYGLKAVENRDSEETLIVKRGDRSPDRVGVVTFKELRCPNWPQLEELVVSLSVSTGAWAE